MAAGSFKIYGLQKDGSRIPAAGGVSGAGGGMASDALKLGGKAPEYYIQPYNLLGNSYFVNPVNQRGQTSYTGNAPYFDRWKSTNARMTATINDGYITLSANTSGTAYLRQVFETPISSGVYTLAICVRGTGDGRMYLTTDNNNAGAGSVRWGDVNDWTVFCVVSDVENATTIPNQFSIYVGAGSTFDIQWCGLFPGSYTADTLPPYVPKGYAAELAECQRYFVQYESNNYVWLSSGLTNGDASSAYFPLHLPVPMRTVPSLWYNDISKILLYTKTVSPNSLMLYSAETNNAGCQLVSIRADLKDKGFTASTACMLDLAPGAILQFSAEL